MVTGSERDGTPGARSRAATLTIGGGQFTLQFANGGPAYKGEAKQAGGPQEFDFVQKEGPTPARRGRRLFVERPAPEDLL